MSKGFLNNRMSGQFMTKKRQRFVMSENCKNWKDII